MKGQLGSFWLKHDDFVHDIQFDYYGKRIATCSSDQLVKIWEKNADLINAGISPEQLGLADDGS